MFASLVTDERCDLFTVVRTDLLTWDKVVLTYAPSDFQTAARRALHYQSIWGGDRYDYRVTQCK